MKLINFRIQFYKSIIDTGVVNLSKFDNISVFVGQNEAGKSSILEALSDYETERFTMDSIPFKYTEKDSQSVSCTYAVSETDNLFNDLEDEIKEEFNLTIGEGVELFDKKKIEKINSFTITRERKYTNEETTLSVDNITFQIIKDAVLLPAQGSSVPADEAAPTVPPPTSVIELKDEDNEKIAASLWRLAPQIILFNEANTLLPDKISVSDLINENGKAIGYRAVRNFEKIAGINFIKISDLQKAKRDSEQESVNDQISIDFQRSWSQRIYGENKVNVKFSFEKEGVENSMYIYFYVETKDREFLEPRKRSKGLIWFLSAWMELKAKESESNKVILYDEPGLYLHIKAHRDVLNLFEYLASERGGNHQVLYTTHSPSLINTDSLNRIGLVINNESGGTTIEGVTTSKINSDNKRDALQPISEAMGLQPFKDFGILNIKNVLVEGLSDFWYFKAFKKLLNNNEDFEFIPGIGIKDGKINHLISFCIGYGLDWKLVMDGGHNSSETREEIKEKVFNGEESEISKYVMNLDGVNGVENMFTVSDLKLIDPKFNCIEKDDKSVKVGKGRKIVFSKTFYEKVVSGVITAGMLDKKTMSNFFKVFEFVKFIT